MPKPTQSQIDTTVEVLEYIVRDMEENEPHAVNTIEQFNEVLQQMPSADELT